ncbi:oligosaccharide flippase family protein [Winogradskyella alexanderae]|uniref:Polysaccharide biosynthesis C-terminal domain-containing protein n=1 Tax=Winogradskyella alexanderae TaxID=2877123 RepID=A0ABS7XTY8_9FLAO|nr:polysaccharide biosynthesis C-terminal domain-containing protein [Winogradskyella alexanderae]MCA0133488.1 polysaccharide biosynthesis C-terminal domain-containing protein [Winogradskyella alexanderae]
MGIILNQSFKNTVTTYLGFGLGAINTLFLYTNFLTDEYYGLVAFLLSTANIMMPFMAFGAHNAIIKYYSAFVSKNSTNGFLTIMLFLPLVLIIPVTLIGYFSYDAIGAILSRENSIVANYTWHIFILAIAMAYFEIFFAWTKVQLQTVFGNLMKEVFHRFAIMLLLLAVHFKYLNVEEFIIGLVIVYVLRTALMKLYAFSIRFPKLNFQIPENFNAILKYALLMIIAGSVAMMILDIDKFMIGLMVEDIEQVAYYSVAIFIATVIAVPQRAMHQIMMPLTAKYLNEGDSKALEDLYKRSSINLLVISGFIFLLIVLNINQLYLILPPKFTGGLFVVFIISIAKLYDNSLGSNNAILFNSDYYKMVLVFGVILALLAIILNAIFIPVYGINGSAIATFLSIAIYNTIKVLFVKSEFNIQPYSVESIKICIVLAILFLLFYFWDFNFHPIVNIALKSLFVMILYFTMVLRLRVSNDISQQIKKYLNI